MTPEVLAPAGSAEALQAALEAGADAVYFGLDEGFNARARAANFPVQQLPEIVARIHRHRARAYLALNTLVFESELEAVADIVRAAALAGVDALIVQDPAICLMARRLCPELELHASTQMTISSPEGAALAREWGVSRVVLPRELSLLEIEKFVAHNPGVEIEVFIAGALCMSWSGQCLSSETWGGRSANRGQCAQACRHPYDLVVDGQRRDLGPLKYLLSPQDLGGFPYIRRLMELGVHTLKIEGRQKDADYVFQAVRAVRQGIEAARCTVAPEPLRLALRDLSLTYSRGLSPGFFEGSDHQSLVQGRHPRHQGLLLGQLLRQSGPRCWVKPAPEAPPAVPGMGVVLRGPQHQLQEEEVGGAVYAVEQEGDLLVLEFGHRGPRLQDLEVGDEIWVTSHPQARRKAVPSRRRWPLTLRILGEVGQPLEVQAGWQHGQARVRSKHVLQLARTGGLDQQLLLEKLGAWGESDFEADGLELEGLQPGLFLPVSELKRLRQQLQPLLEHQLQQLGRKVLVESPTSEVKLPVQPLGPVVLEPLVRTPEQLRAVIAAAGDPNSLIQGCTLDWMEMVGLNGAVAQTREAGLKVGLATVRVQKPGEECYDRRLEGLQPDWVLARHWGAVLHFSRSPRRPAEVHGDFSLNVTNSHTARCLIELGLNSVTLAHDLDRVQVGHLLQAFPPGYLCVTAHHHIATFHTEHCTYSHLLSQGRDYRSCGRPCEKHLLELEDRKGLRHPVIVDVGCRNTVFNARAQTCLSLIPGLVRAGLGRLRLEFVRESFEEVLQVLRTYQALLRGEIDIASARQQVAAHEQFGVSLGTMAVLKS